MKKISISTNMDNAKYYLEWVETNNRGTIRTYNRVFKTKQNMDALFAQLAMDSKVDYIHYGEGRTNRANTQMKVATMSEWKRGDEC